MFTCLGTHLFVQIQLWENSDCLSLRTLFSLVSDLIEAWSMWYSLFRKMVSAFVILDARPVLLAVLKFLVHWAVLVLKMLRAIVIFILPCRRNRVSVGWRHRHNCRLLILSIITPATPLWLPFPSVAPYLVGMLGEDP